MYLTEAISPFYATLSRLRIYGLEVALLYPSHYEIYDLINVYNEHKHFSNS